MIRPEKIRIRRDATRRIAPGWLIKTTGEAGIGVDTETLATYSIPTLFVTGELDVLFPAEYIEALATTVPGAECVNLGQVGHSSYFELPEVFNAEVRRFLGRHSL